MVVVVQPGILEPVCLGVIKHAQCHAAFQSQRLYTFDHGAHGFKVMFLGLRHAAPMQKRAAPAAFAARASFSTSSTAIRRLAFTPPSSCMALCGQ